MKLFIERRCDLKTLRCIIMILAVLPALSLASSTPAPEVIKENEGLFQWVLGIALLGNGIFIGRTLKSIDRLWGRATNIEKRLGRLEGQHDAYHNGRSTD